ncbi:MAG: hypothetical protein HC807_06715 [Gammaproteobacteria bacterium]|nr:hypothetical protein [Gammaproteobacteria bacterium]
MQERGDEGLRIEMPVGEDLGDRHRMVDVGLAALSELPVMGAVAEVISLFEPGEVAGLR